MDTLSRSQRSLRMSLIRHRNTKPEIIVRNLIRAAGYRYRANVVKLPGKPDMVFPKIKKVIFVHGCFWHRHPNCSLARLPKSRLEFWLPKLEGNRKRDLRNIRRLRRDGWAVKLVWECQLGKRPTLEKAITRFLDRNLE